MTCRYKNANPYPLTQQQMARLSRFRRGATTTAERSNVTASSVLVEGVVSVARLRSAARTTVDRFPVLRSRFVGPSLEQQVIDPCTSPDPIPVRKHRSRERDDLDDVVA